MKASHSQREDLPFQCTTVPEYKGLVTRMEENLALKKKRNLQCPYTYINVPMEQTKAIITENFILNI